jgi:hypothetical protein
VVQPLGNLARAIHVYTIYAHRDDNMPLVKAITKHGNSAGIILDQALLRVVGWDIGTAVELLVKGNSIVLSRHKATAPVPLPPAESPDK